MEVSGLLIGQFIFDLKNHVLTLKMKNLTVRFKILTKCDLSYPDTFTNLLHALPRIESWQSANLACTSRERFTNRSRSSSEAEPASAWEVVPVGNGVPALFPHGLRTFRTDQTRLRIRGNLSSGIINGISAQCIPFWIACGARC